MMGVFWKNTASLCEEIEERKFRIQRDVSVGVTFTSQVAWRFPVSMQRVVLKVRCGSRSPLDMYHVCVGKSRKFFWKELLESSVER
ncbi:hypothetical protein SUGI_0815040 [Cryptomeria japonica]|nr:hypothetical protein SUGI_0815040 [Cryptomeria japonica]